MPKSTAAARRRTRPTTASKRVKGRAKWEATAFVMENGRPTFALIPYEEYEQLLVASMGETAIATLDDPNTKWVDADELGLQLAGERIAKARKAAGLTQKQLGGKLKLPQSQISRIERNPDRTTVRTLKKIAKALNVDVSALV